MKRDNVIKILFIEDAVDAAERTVSLLRNHGVAVRPAQASNAAELEAACEGFRPELVLINPKAGDLPVADAIKLIVASGKDMAVVGLVEHVDDATIARMFADGLQVLVSLAQPEQVVQVVKREFQALQTRRAVRQLEGALRESERRCDALLASSRDPIAYVHEGMHVRANQAYLDVFGYAGFADIEGLTLLDMVAPDDAADFKTLLQRLAKGEAPPQHVEFNAVKANGDTFAARMEFSPATFAGEACLQIVLRRRRAADKHMAEQLQRDPATGLFHRAHMLEVIDAAVAAAGGGTAGQVLLMIEPDNWDTAVGAVGLANTDPLVAALGKRIADGLGENMVLGRLSEHRLGIVLSQCTDQNLDTFISGLLDTVAKGVFEAGKHSVGMTISVGGSLLGERNASTQQLLEQTDVALREAQSRGTGMVQLHDPAAEEKAVAAHDQERLVLIKHALAHDGFALYRQRIISLQDASGDFSELRLRIKSPNGEVAPEYFVPVARQHGLIPAIDRWMLDKAIDLLTGRPGKASSAVTFVPLTVATLADAGFADWLQGRLESSHLAAGALVIAIAESEVTGNLALTRDFVTRMRPLGVAFALDGFGAGLNSFQNLNHVDATYLRIDRSFMQELPQHEDNRNRLGTICRKAHELDKLTVADGVEDAVSTSILFGCGADFVQGDFLRAPERVLLLAKRAA